MAEGSTWLERRSVQVPNMVLVEPGSLDASYLWLKLQGEHSSMGGYGTRMPPEAALDAAAMDTIQEWILSGALP